MKSHGGRSAVKLFGSVFGLPWENRPRDNQDWRNDALFDMIVNYAMHFKSTHKERAWMKTLFKHTGIIERLKSLADGFPFLWHGIRLQDLILLGSLIDLFPQTILNYVYHMLTLWKRDLMHHILNINGSLDTLSRAHVGLLSGAWPQVANNDQDNIIGKLSKDSVSPAESFEIAEPYINPPYLSGIFEFSRF
jgi:hypothetical protein